MDIFNNIILSGTVTAKKLQVISNLPILNLELKHFAKRPFKIQVKLWGERAYLIDGIIRCDDRVTVSGKLKLLSYKDKDEFVIVAHKVAKMQNGKNKIKEEKERQHLS